MFKHVFEAQSVTRAALNLNISQPAVSRAIAQLEAEVGFELFGRVNGRFYPTPDAIQLYAATSRLFGELTGFESEVKELKTGRCRKFSIATIPSLTHHLVTPAAAKIVEHNPAVKVDISMGDGASVIHELEHLRADVGVLHQSQHTNPNLNYDVIGKSEVVAVVPNNFPFANREALTTEDLDQVPIILMTSGSLISELVKQAFKKSGARANVILEANSAAIANTAATSGVAIALIDPWATLASPSSNVLLKRFIPTISLDITVARPKDRPNSEIVKTFTDSMRKVLKQTAQACEFVIAS
jgi:DNA-binding transcriptional LysR family regulator